MTNSKQGFLKLGDVLKKYQTDDSDKYVSREFQKYGFELAQSLGDLKHKSLYIKLAKETPRVMMENAKSFVMDANNAKNKGSLFMWRLQQLKNEKINRNRKAEESISNTKEPFAKGNEQL
jgi:outer membrane usher protein FimD/PapC